MRARARHSTRIAAVLLAGLLARPATAAEPRPYSFAVIPQAPPATTRALWLPVVERIAAASGVPLELRIHAQVDEFQEDLAAGRVDFAFVNPVQAIRAHQGRDYRPLVRNERLVRAVFFVAADSPIESVDALAQREIAFVGPWSLCSVTLRAYASELRVRPKFVGTSANAYKNVLLGMTPGGGVLDTTLEDAPPEIRARLRVVYETPPIAAHAIIAHPRVPPDAASRVSAALLALAKGEGRGLLAPVHLDAPIEASYARDYGVLEAVLDGPKPSGKARP